MGLPSCFRYRPVAAESSTARLLPALAVLAVLTDSWRRLTAETASMSLSFDS